MTDVGAVVLGGHVQGLGIVRSLGRRGIPVFVLDDTDACIARFSRYCNRFFRVRQMLEGPALIRFLHDLSGTHRTRGWMLYPTHDATVEILAEHREELQNAYRVSVPPLQQAMLALDKARTHRLALDSGVPVPQTRFPGDEQEFVELVHASKGPVILKPAVMHRFYAKLGVKAIPLKPDTPASELRRTYARIAAAVPISEIMLQDLVPGSPDALYSCCCLSDNGKLLASVVAQRPRQIPMDFGKATTFARTVPQPELQRLSEALLRRMGYTGLAEVEFKWDPRDGQFKLLEINARTWKWHTLAIRAGLDMPYLLFAQSVFGREPVDVSAATDVKWVDIYPDTWVALKEILGGRLSIKTYIDTLRGPIEHAVPARDDPLPFIAYTLLLPYLLAVR